MPYIEKIVKKEGFALTLLFNTGEKKTVDLFEAIQEWSKSPESAFRFLLDPVNFSRVQLENDFGSLYWENGLDLCPDVLYDMALPSKNANAKSETMHAAAYAKYPSNMPVTKAVKEKGTKG